MAETLNQNQKEMEVNAPDFLAGGGEMGERIRAFDWSATTLGPVNTWSQSLRTTLSILLNARFPMLLWWGEDLVQFYNDAYRPSLGNEGKHPTALGQKCEDCWPEIWTIIKPLIDQVLSGGEATWSEDQLIPFYRNGKIEDIYWTFSYSPVYNESGEVGGVLVVCHETTEKVTNLKKLEESEDQLKFAIEATELGTWDYNPLNDKFTANTQLKDWFGLPPQAEIALSLAISVIAEKDQQRVAQAIGHALQYASGGKYDIEYTIIHPITQQETIVRAKGRAWFNEDHIAYRFNGTLQDVTQEAIVKKELTNKKQDLELAIKIGELGVFKIDLLRNTATYSQPVMEWFGLTEQHVSMQEILSKTHPEDQAMVAEILQQTLDKEGGGRHDFIYRIVHPEDGKLRYLRSIGQVLFEEEKPLAMSGLIQDVTHQEQTKEVLKESAARFRSLIEESPVATCLFTGRDMIIEVANETMIRIWGKGVAVMGKPLKEALPELEGQPFLQILDDVFTTGKTYEARNAAVILVVDDIPDTYYFDFTYTPLFNTAGEVYGVMYTAVDVTEQVVARKKLEESEQFLRNIILTAPVAMNIFKGPSFVVELANDRMFEVWGRPSEDILNKPVFEALPEAKGFGFEELLTHVYTMGETVSANEQPVQLPRNGNIETVYITVVYAPFREGDGTISGVIAVAVDVTQQVLSRKTLEENQKALKRFKFMADQARDPLILMREDGTFAYLNEKAIEAWGYTEEEARHISVPQVDPVYQKEPFLQLFAKAQKEAIPQLETLHKRKDGHIFPVEVTVTGLILNGKPHMFAIARDITERKKAEASLESKNEQLLRINNDLDNFIYTASHDLKAPISNIEALLHALLRVLSPESLASERTQRITAMMQDSVERFKKTIANLTEVVKLQKEHSGEAVLVDLAEVIREVRLDLEPMIKAAHAQLEVDIAGCPAIRFSEKNMRSVVYNLLSNAIKYRSPDRTPQVRIRCESTPERYLLTVADNGLGMEAGRLSQLFTMFKRFHAHIEGTGIGLYMIRKMVDNAGGRIEVESQVNVGTTFRVYFQR